MKATEEQIARVEILRDCSLLYRETREAATAVLSELATLRAAAERHRGSREDYRDLHTIADAYLAEHPADGEEPISEEWLHSIGFEDDRTGCPTLGPLHIQHAAITRMDSDVEYPASACVRSFPIPVPKTRGDVRRLCSAMGIELKETP